MERIKFGTILFSVIVFMFLLSSCATVEKRYEGPDKPKAEIVILFSTGYEYHYLPGTITESVPGTNVELAFEG